MEIENLNKHLAFSRRIQYFRFFWQIKIFTFSLKKTDFLFLKNTKIIVKESLNYMRASKKTFGFRLMEPSFV